VTNRSVSVPIVTLSDLAQGTRGTQFLSGEHHMYTRSASPTAINSAW